ncbi:hypothetical protein DBV15_12976 [Temnothorax longispinosus]|uniref:Uncharacterized protein n=1 Tax=Temnothorax longispinosus TaxID=300112 RepID=A0A4S2KYC6_9HYME|nr:hypothetical protein DBV15_12976 [Temnothorax longispinosus]
MWGLCPPFIFTFITICYKMFVFFSAHVWQCGFVVKRQTRNPEEPGLSPPDHRNFYIPNCTPRHEWGSCGETGLSFGGDIKFEIGLGLKEATTPRQSGIVD